MFKTDILIVGAGMVGLSLAFQLKKRFPKYKITLIEKENVLGMHSSGRNSGVLHAGIYYKPNSLKASICVDGAKRLKEWCKEENLKILNCGKVISPQSINLDKQLDVLLDRGIKNGAKVEIIDHKDFKKLVPQGRTASGRALWSPNTSVIEPLDIVRRLEKRLIEQGVIFIKGVLINEISPELKKVNYFKSEQNFKDINQINYGYLFNTAGVNADLIAKKFEVGMRYTLLPFKGLYWELEANAPFEIKTNFYPVPDLDIPFLGVHFTPTLNNKIIIGPTAIPSFGRENYDGFKGFELFNSLKFLSNLGNQWIQNKNGFRNYVREQAFQGFKPYFLKSAQKLLPTIKSNHLKKSKKVGIRAQLYDKSTRSLVNDFRLEHGLNSTHVLNAISPAFTASFALADLIIDQTPDF